MTVWYSGKDNYRKYTFANGLFNTELLDVEVGNRSMSEALVDALPASGIELLYSGGIDSEFVLNLCLANSIPVTAITMRLHCNGTVINTHDMYYSEKYCRQNGIDQTIIDLNVTPFYENGDYLDYLAPYQITMPHVATHLWLIEQCSHFPVMGGNYDWPWAHGEHRVISPMKHVYGQYDRFMQDRGITGIGNMLNHSLEINLLGIKEHLALLRNDVDHVYGFGYTDNNRLRKSLYENLGSSVIEPRFNSYGWERVDPRIYNRKYYADYLESQFGTVKNTITWGYKMAEALGGAPGTWDQF